MKGNYRTEIRKTPDGYEAVLLKDDVEKSITELPWYHPAILPSLLTGRVVKEPRA